MLQEGQPAPNFALSDQNGQKHSLSEMKGTWLLLYFYPKDNTPGCTKEACSIRDAFPRFEKLKLTVWGVSLDSVKSHKSFAEKYELPFTLLSDEKKETVKKYGVWAKKKFMGMGYMGTKRMSFLISPRGTIAKIFENVKPEKHANDVLKEFETFSS